jgi:hypothetical protein
MGGGGAKWRKLDGLCLHAYFLSTHIYFYVFYLIFPRNENTILLAERFKECLIYVPEYISQRNTSHLCQNTNIYAFSLLPSQEGREDRGEEGQEERMSRIIKRDSLN